VSIPVPIQAQRWQQSPAKLAARQPLAQPIALARQ
jgi:hypothetical protein